MVSVGTIFTLGLVAALGVAGYAVYRNAGKIGDVLATGVSKSISDPFSNWLDSLFQNASASSNGSEGIPPPGPPQQPTGPTETDLVLAGATEAGITDPFVRANLADALLTPAERLTLPGPEMFLPSGPPPRKQGEPYAKLTIQHAVTRFPEQFATTKAIIGARGTIKSEPTIKFYDFISTPEKEFLPLGKAAVDFYRGIGKYVSEVYL